MMTRLPKKGIYAISKKYVTQADTGYWIVRGTDGSKSYDSTLFPKETCITLAEVQKSFFLGAFLPEGLSFIFLLLV